MKNNKVKLNAISNLENNKIMISNLKLKDKIN